MGTDGRLRGHGAGPRLGRDNQPSPRRLEYDAYRTDLEELSMGPRDASTLCRLDAAQSQFQSHKDKYEKLRADVAIKLKFLEENKVGEGCGAGTGPWGAVRWGGELAVHSPHPLALPPCGRLPKLPLFGWAAGARAGERPAWEAGRRWASSRGRGGGAASI